MSKLIWSDFNEYIIGKSNNEDITGKNIAAFDLDDTLIKSSKNNKDCDSNNDNWIFYHDSVKNKLKSLSLTHKIVIITNQKGVGKDADLTINWKKKIENIHKCLDIDLIILVSLKDDMYRKPRTCLWTKYINGNPNKSFYCGDAAGLPKRIINNVTIKKDFSDTDLKFALNLGIKFIHRDEFIFDIEYKTDKYNIKYPIDFTKIKHGNFYDFHPNSSQEMLINVGLPGSGKSYFSNKIASIYKYHIINQDTLITSKKCIKETEYALQNKESVVIDNTNVTKEARKMFIDIAKKYNVPYRCFLFTTDVNLCIHNNHFRNFITQNQVNILPDVVFHTKKKYYVKPDESEGFQTIEKIDFSLELDNNNKKIYEMYYF